MARLYWLDPLVLSDYAWTRTINWFLKIGESCRNKPKLIQDVISKCSLLFCMSLSPIHAFVFGQGFQVRVINGFRALFFFFNQTLPPCPSWGFQYWVMSAQSINIMRPWHHGLVKLCRHTITNSISLRNGYFNQATKIEVIHIKKYEWDTFIPWWIYIILTQISQYPPDVWIYDGACQNHPSFLDCTLTFKKKKHRITIFLG